MANIASRLGRSSSSCGGEVWIWEGWILVGGNWMLGMGNMWVREVVIGFVEVLDTSVYCTVIVDSANSFIWWMAVKQDNAHDGPDTQHDNITKWMSVATCTSAGFKYSSHRHGWIYQPGILPRFSQPRHTRVMLQCYHQWVPLHHFLGWHGIDV